MTGVDLIAALCQVGRDAVAAGLVVASGGNLSARLPGADTCWVTRAGTWLDRLTPDDLVEVRLDDGRPVDTPAATVEPPPSGRRRDQPAEFASVAAGTSGERTSRSETTNGAPPSTELALHLATYRVRPDVHAIVHLHPQMAVLLDSLGEPIRLVTTDHAFYVRRVGRTPFHPPNSVELADAAAAAVADGTNCVILAHHGCSVLGGDVEMAFRRALNLEEAARLTYRGLLLRSVLGRDLVECPWDLPTTTLI